MTPEERQQRIAQIEARLAQLDTPPAAPQAERGSFVDNLGGMIGSGVSEMLTAGPQMAGRYADFKVNHPMLSSIPVAGDLLAAGNAMFVNPDDPSALGTAENVARTAGRGGAMYAGGALGALGGPFSLATIPLGVAAGGYGWDMLEGAVTGEDPNSALAFGAGEQAVKDVVQTALPIAALKGAPMAARGLSRASRWTNDRIGPPPPPGVNTKATLADPGNMDAILLESEMRNAPVPNEPRIAADSPTGQLLRGGIETRSQILHDYGAGLDELAASLGIGENATGVHKALYEKWKGGKGQAVVDTGLLRATKKGRGELEGMGKAYQGELMGERQKIVETIQASRPNEVLPPDSLQRALAPFDAQVAQFRDLIDALRNPETAQLVPRSPELEAAMRLENELNNIRMRTENLTPLGALNYAVEINARLRNLEKIWDNPELAKRSSFNDSAGYNEVKPILSAARDSIWDWLNQKAEAVGYEKNAIGNLNYLYGGAELAEDIGALQRQNFIMNKAERGAARLLTNTEGAEPEGFGANIRVGARIGNYHPIMRGGALYADPRKLGAWLMRRISGPEPLPASPALESGYQNQTSGQRAMSKSGRVLDIMEGRSPEPAGIIYDPVSPSLVQKGLAHTASALGSGSKMLSQLPGSIDGKMAATVPAIIQDQTVPGYETRAMSMAEPLLDNMTPDTLLPVVTAIDPMGVPILKDPMVVQGVLQQLDELFAEGNQDKMAAYISQLRRAYPKLAIRKGPFTGLPSEFQIDSSRSKLYDPQDRALMEQKITDGPYPPNEKALRIAHLRKHGYVYPAGAMVSPQPPPEAKNPNSGGYQYAPRSNGRRNG